MLIPRLANDDPTLTLQNVRKSYDRQCILDDISLSFSLGLTLLTGRSGVGKSTLLRIIATAETPDGGSMAWRGVSLPRARKALRRTLGYAPQLTDLPEDLTANEFALYIGALKELDLLTTQEQIFALAEDVGLRGALNSRLSSFSGGMRRRLILLQALLGTPQLLALDEPAAELDSSTAQLVASLIVKRSKQAIVVMTTHLEEELRAHSHPILRMR